MDGTTQRILRYGMALLAVVFGLMTLKAGGSVLFGGEAARRAAGDYVPFVVWFNFIAGFAYVAAGLGIWWRWPPIRWLTVSIVAGSAVTYAAFGLHIWSGGAWEVRTVVAMAIRTGLWFGIAFGTFWLSGQRRRQPAT